MTKLQHAALAHLPLSRETVESFYDGSRAGTAEKCLRALCESHERLRAELEGLDVMLREAEGRLDMAVALTDTGSDEFRKAFPPRAAGDMVSPREVVPGWRVVEKIREALL